MGHCLLLRIASAIFQLPIFATAGKIYVIVLFSEPFHTQWSNLEPNTPACHTARGFDVSANINRFQSARYDILTVLLLKIQIFFTVILWHWACSTHCFEDHLVLK
jgi:hypothetical protein